MLIRKWVQATRERQRIRFKEQTLFITSGNRDYRSSDMCMSEVCQFCKLDETGDSLVQAMMSPINKKI